MIQINTLKEAKKFLNKKTTIFFQNKIFYKEKDFKDFIEDIEDGAVFQVPQNCDYYAFYCDFGTIYCDKLIITKNKLLFFNKDVLLLELYRHRTDDIEMSYAKNNCNYSSNPLTYDCEQDIQFENF